MVITRLIFLLILLSPIVYADCLNDTIFSFSGTGLNDWTLVNFSTLNQYVDNDLTRVYVSTGNDNFKYDDYELLINTSIGFESYTVHIKDETFNEAKTDNDSTPDLVVDLNRSDLTQPGGFYNITFRWENLQEEVLNIGNYSTLDLIIHCDSYSPTTIDLISLDQTTVSRATRETPNRFRVNFDQTDIGELFRERYITDTESHFDFYIPHTKDGSILNINYVLDDYTGGYSDSIAHIQRSMAGDTYTDVESRQFDDNDEINGVSVFKDIDYKIVLTTGTGTNDKGLYKYTVNGTQEIRVTEPPLNFGDDSSDGVTLTTWRNLTTGRVYCYWLVEESGDFINSSIFVYNYSIAGNTLLYSTSDVSNPEGTFSYLVPNQNYTYLVDCNLITTLRPFSKRNYFSFQNTSIRFYGPTWTHEVLGFSVVELFGGISLFVLIFVLGFASQINGSYIALGTAGLLYLFNLFGWIVVDGIILGFILVLAVLYRLRQSRLGVG